MKFKLFTRKNNGELRKTPEYHDDLNESCISRLFDKEYNIYHTSLYELYCYAHRCLMEYDRTVGKLYISNRIVTNEILKNVIWDVITEKQSEITYILGKKGSRCSDLEEVFLKKNGSLYFEAYEKQKIVDEYKLLQLDINSLHDNKICREVKGYEFDYTESVNYILDDIEPLTPQDILKKMNND